MLSLYNIYKKNYLIQIVIQFPTDLILIFYKFKTYCVVSDGNNFCVIELNLTVAYYYLP